MKKARRESTLKKKLFIAGAYLILAVLMILFVSYSSYRITYEGEVVLPLAARPASSIQVDYNLADIIPQKATPTEAQKQAGIVPELIDDPLPPGGLRADSYVLGGLLPGESAQAAMEQDLRSRKLVVKVNNKAELGKGQLDLKYTLGLTLEGIIPLEVIAVHLDASGNKIYKGRISRNAKTRSIELKDDEGNAPAFDLPADKDKEDTWYLYFGWNNEDLEADGSNRASDLQREVSVIRVNAGIWNLPETSDSYGTEDELKQQLDDRFKPKPADP